MSHPYTRPSSPPIDPQLGFDGSFQSPSLTASSHSSAGIGAQYSGGAFHSVQATSHDPERQHSPRLSSHAGSMHAPSSQTVEPKSEYPLSPTSDTSYHHYSVPSTSSQQPMYYQSPTASTFSPGLRRGAGSTTPISSETSPVESKSQWQRQQPQAQPHPPPQHQYHHHVTPSGSTSFSGQATERYVCQVCNKAFSRPSSLKIHSHSHTGEKPFICPAKGCGKAFSVRSNMKRHERGCHGGGGSEELHSEQ